MTPKFTRAKSISTDTALKAIQASREGNDYRLTESDISYIGDPNGKLWPDSDADQLAEILSKIQEAAHVSGYSIRERQEFDRHASKTIHEALVLTPEIIVDPGFWRWLAVDKLYEILEKRHRSRGQYAGLKN
ncbi:MAG: hypothetical protein OXC95_01505, partial [Dehalococcoidia bacterium]|nr:hypothetical protein [Dehalococcoidia bacterium]